MYSLGIGMTRYNVQCRHRFDSIICSVGINDVQLSLCIVVMYRYRYV